MARRETVAFVLSGGAGLGAIQVGMLRALYERGVAPDLIVGTSAGALNGAFIASRPLTVATADALGAVWRGVRRSDAFPLNPVTGLLGFLGVRDHLVPASGLKRLIERNTERDRLEDLPVPLHVVAVDVLTGEELRLSAGDLPAAILASAAIPGVLGPVGWDGRVLMDGGVANNTPISHAVELGADRIYVLPTGHACALPEPPRGALAMALHAISLLTQRRLIDDIERHRDSAKLVVLPPPARSRRSRSTSTTPTSSSPARSPTRGGSSPAAARIGRRCACGCIAMATRRARSAQSLRPEGDLVVGGRGRVTRGHVHLEDGAARPHRAAARRHRELDAALLTGLERQGRAASRRPGAGHRRRVDRAG
jgi:NTE family protein